MVRSAKSMSAHINRCKSPFLKPANAAARYHALRPRGLATTDSRASSSSLGGRLDNLDLNCIGTVSEIVPEAETTSRTFSVKVTGPCPPGVYSGMFGHVLIPLDDEEVLVIPNAAVRHVGQLALVDVVEDQTVRRRAVQLGRRFGQDVEVLSGLRDGEQVALPASSAINEDGK